MKTLNLINTTTKTYAKYETAVKVAETVVYSVFHTNHEMDITVIIAAAPNGRFSPVFHLRPAAHYLAAAIAGKGFHVIG